MMTGDSSAVARAVADEIGIDLALSQVLPDDKARHNQELQAKLAAGVLASRGIVLSPAIGAGLMSASTIIVAVNAQLLRRPLP